MKATVKKWGNSAAVRIPASVMESTPLHLDDDVDVSEDRGRIIRQPVRHRSYRLEDLLRGINAKNLPELVDSGPPAGKEIWWMTKPYVPEAGDIVWPHFTPQAGHEHAGRRPAIVLSPAAYNAKTSLMLCCPLTSQAKGYPFEVAVGDEAGSVVLSDRVKSLDWRSREAKRKGRVSSEVLGEIRANVHALVG